MAFDPAFLEELRARLPLASIIGRKTKLVRSGRNWKACCPFHGEKTPSFYVYEDHFHCYGCGAHGDVISFVMQSDGRSFMEAVEALAAEAGLEVPRLSAAVEQKAEEKKTIIDALMAADRFFQQALREDGGKEARYYLQKRGISEQTAHLFGLGWASAGQGLLSTLQAEGFTEDSLEKSGLFRRDEKTGKLRSFFFNRVMFPIMDRSFRPLSFGGRILGEGQPKYLNGPETEVFSKRTVLFGLAQAGQARKNARATTRVSDEVIVVEGYMDVITLHQAGFVQSVAPLGTALTVEQLERLWRLTPAPVVCFDGDAAGRKAALRAIETALPQLTAQQSLRLCLLPQGEDPDSVVQKYGFEKFSQIIKHSRPLSESVFLLLSEGVNARSSPEQKAQLKHVLDEFASRIRDKTLSREYARTLSGFYYELCREKGYSKGRYTSTTMGARLNSVSGWGKPDKTPFSEALATRKPLPTETMVELNRKSFLVALAILYPEILKEVEEPLGRLDMPESLKQLCRVVLEFSAEQYSVAYGEDTEKIRARMQDYLHEKKLWNDWEALHSSTEIALKKDLDPAVAQEWWWHFYGLLSRAALEEELQKAKNAFANHPNLQNQTSLMRMASALLKLGREEFRE